MKNVTILVALVFSAIGCVSAEDHAEEFGPSERGDTAPISGAAGAPVVVSGAGGAVAQQTSAGGSTGAAGAPVVVVSGAGGAVAQQTSAGGSTGAAGAPAPALAAYGEDCPAYQVGGDPSQVSCQSGVCVNAPAGSVCGCKYSDECSPHGYMCESGTCKSVGSVSVLTYDVNCRTLSDCLAVYPTVPYPRELVCNSISKCQIRTVSGY